MIIQQGEGNIVEKCLSVSPKIKCIVPSLTSLNVFFRPANVIWLVTRSNIFFHLQKKQFKSKQFIFMFEVKNNFFCCCCCRCRVWFYHFLLYESTVRRVFVVRDLFNNNIQFKISEKRMMPSRRVDCLLASWQRIFMLPYHMMNVRMNPLDYREPWIVCIIACTYLESMLLD